MRTLTRRARTRVALAQTGRGEDRGRDFSASGALRASAGGRGYPTRSEGHWGEGGGHGGPPHWSGPRHWIRQSRSSTLVLVHCGRRESEVGGGNLKEK